MPTAVTARAAAARLVAMRFALVCALLATLASAARVEVLLTDAQSVRVQSTAVQSAAVQDATTVAYVPHFAGLPCADSGSCPWGPNCTVCGNYWCACARPARLLCAPCAHPFPLAPSQRRWLVWREVRGRSPSQHILGAQLTRLRVRSCVPEGDSCDFSVEPQQLSCTDACVHRPARPRARRRTQLVLSCLSWRCCSCPYPSGWRCCTRLSLLAS
jgi:hypothetical protein